MAAFHIETNYEHGTIMLRFTAKDIFGKDAVVLNADGEPDHTEISYLTKIGARHEIQVQAHDGIRKLRRMDRP